MDLRVERLFELRLDLGAREHVGETPFGDRWSTHIASGSFEGPSLRGVVLPASGDWPLVSPSGAMRIDARLTLRTDAGALVFASYRGVRAASPEVLARLRRGESVDPSDVYFRVAMLFETAAEPLGFLNELLAVGIGRRVADRVEYDVYQLL